jgi:predicted DNA-binding protein
MKNKRFNLKATDQFVERLHKISKAADKTASDFVREAINEKAERLAKRNPKVAQILQEATA